jgi:hypothetical protein
MKRKEKLEFTLELLLIPKIILAAPPFHYVIMITSDAGGKKA